MLGIKLRRGGGDPGSGTPMAATAIQPKAHHPRDPLDIWRQLNYLRNKENEKEREGERGCRKNWGKRHSAGMTGWVKIDF